MKSVSFRLYLTLTILLGLCAPALTQTFTGGIRGAVRDPGGIVPGALVELTNEATGATRDTRTNEQGEFSFSAVPPGTYTLKASLSGFKTHESKGIRIGAQQFITLDVTLEVGEVKEVVTVTGESPLIETSNASTGSVIDTKQLEMLPSGGRSAFLFAVTVPTVIASGDGQFNRQQDQTNASLLSLGGGTRRGNNYLLDGVPITDLRNRASAMPSIEALEDVNIQVHLYDAEASRTGGGIFNTATKSGTNDWHGSGFYQLRPRDLSANNFFSDRTGVAKPDTYFHLGGGGVGGPVIRNRTFFYFSSEGYGSNTTRNGSLRLPTQRERNGDFSRSFDSAGRLIVIYDPLTGNPDGTGRQAFEGNIVPAHRINPVAKAIASFLPLPKRDESDGRNNFDSTAEIHDRAVMYTGKVDHTLTDTVSLSGFYLYNKTDEPCANFAWPGLSHPNRFIDRNDYLLLRRVHVLALNNTWVPGNNTVLTLRYGWTRFIDDDTLSVPFDTGSLGFNQNFLGQIQVQKFPRASITDYYAFGAIDPTPRNWYSWSANATLSRLMGRHTLKLGTDYRTVGIKTQSFAGGAGDFRFDRFFTSSNPLTNGTGGTSPSGIAFASFLMGDVSGDPGNLSRVGVSQPFNAFVHYYGAYAQDDFRVSGRTTLNFGLRVEHESGLMEENDRFTVAFDRTLNPGGALGNVVNPLTGQRITGGLVYAGVNGANRYQGDPPAVKVAPRAGIVHSFNKKTVLRAGYGIYWAPWNYQPVGAANYGQIGFSRQTFTEQNQFRPVISLTNPFPQGILQPANNALGALTGVGGEIEFIDQNKKAPWVQQYSVDILRELPGNMAVGFEYTGATGRDLGLGGSNDGIVNINQLDPAHLALGSALLENVPNPFFGLPAGQGFNVTSSTVQRRQLLRPYPQFANILMRQMTAGKNQYHAGILKFEKRVTRGWGGRVNYTYSRLKDNQFGEGNFFSSTAGEALNAYDLDAEYALGLLDVPHKLAITPIFELPFGEGKRWATSGVAAYLLGGWTLSSIITLESGFPISLSTSTNTTQIFTRYQRPNPGTGDPATDGDRSDRLHPVGLWLNSAAYTTPANFTLGTVPRTVDDVRTPHRNNWDFVAAKDLNLGGTRRGQIKIEVLNVTNTAKVRGPVTTVGSSTFGLIDTQSGFMRMTQIMFRMTF